MFGRRSATSARHSSCLSRCTSPSTLSSLLLGNPWAQSIAESGPCHLAHSLHLYIGAHSILNENFIICSGNVHTLELELVYFSTIVLKAPDIKLPQGSLSESGAPTLTGNGSKTHYTISFVFLTRVRIFFLLYSEYQCGLY